MRRDAPWSAPRRTVLELVSTGTVIGAASARDELDGARADDTDSSSNPDAPLAERGVMFPYQIVPGRQITVVEPDLEWRPRGLESTHRTHAISYDHAPSFRAFLFTASDASVRPGRSLALGPVREAVSETTRPAVAVDLESPASSGVDDR